MKYLLTDKETGENFLEENGARKPITLEETKALVMENCGTRGDFTQDGKFKRLELLTMDEWQKSFESRNWNPSIIS